MKPKTKLQCSGSKKGHVVKTKKQATARMLSVARAKGLIK